MCTILITRCSSSVVRGPFTFHIFDFSYETAEQNSTKLYREQDLKALYKVVFFGPIGQQRWPPRPLIGYIFYFSKIAERNSTKFGVKQDLNVLFQVCVFRADRKNQDDRHGLWLAETQNVNVLYQVCVYGPIGKPRWSPNLWLAETSSTSLLKQLNRIQLTRQEAKSKPYLPSFFRSDWKTKMATLASDLPSHFSTSPLKPLNGIQWILTGCKISMPSTKFV